jgi:ABC-2 type transport system permease protein/fluoroquinolone transport system permease protein
MIGRKAGGFAGLVRQDLVMAYRNGLILVAVVLSTVLILLVNFAFPKSAKLSAREYVVDSTPDRFVAAYLQRAGKAASLLGSEDELLDMVKKDRTAVGIAVRGNREAPSAVIYRQGNEPEGAMQGLNAALAVMLREASGQAAQGTLSLHHEQVLLRPDAAKPPFNQSMVPVILATEVTLLGYLFAAVMVFQEKAEGSINAYRVSPRGAWPYVASKLVSNTVLSVGYGAAILLFTVGPSVSLLPALGLVALAALLLSAVGLTISVFFEDLSGFLYPAMGLFLVFGLPVTAYFFPALQVRALGLIPSYPLAFGIREVLFPTGKQAFYLPVAATLTLEAAVMALVCVRAVGKRLMKEAI